MFNALSKYKAVSVIETSTDLAYFQHFFNWNFLCFNEKLSHHPLTK